MKGAPVGGILNKLARLSRDCPRLLGLEWCAKVSSGNAVKKSTTTNGSDSDSYSYSDGGGDGDGDDDGDNNTTTNTTHDNGEVEIGTQNTSSKFMVGAHTRATGKKQRTNESASITFLSTSFASISTPASMEWSAGPTGRSGSSRCARLGWITREQQRNKQNKKRAVDTRMPVRQGQTRSSRLKTDRGDLKRGRCNPSDKHPSQSGIL